MNYRLSYSCGRSSAISGIIALMSGAACRVRLSLSPNVPFLVSLEGPFPVMLSRRIRKSPIRIPSRHDRSWHSPHLRRRVDDGTRNARAIRRQPWPSVRRRSRLNSAARTTTPTSRLRAAERSASRAGRRSFVPPTPWSTYSTASQPRASRRSFARSGDYRAGPPVMPMVMPAASPFRPTRLHRSQSAAGKYLDNSAGHRRSSAPPHLSHAGGHWFESSIVHRLRRGCENPAPSLFGRCPWRCGSIRQPEAAPDGPVCIRMSVAKGSSR